MGTSPQVTDLHQRLQRHHRSALLHLIGHGRPPSTFTRTADPYLRASHISHMNLMCISSNTSVKDAP